MSAARAKDVFLDALERPPDERRELVRRACAGDERLRAEVEALLAAHDSGSSLVDGEGAGALGGLAARALAALDAAPGDALGDYRLERVLGEGGFGRVFLAEQLRPVRRRVALKVLKLGMDTRRVLARFEAERHVLARMDHPGIARVLDAGTTPSGRPYFVMELVDGVPIARHCAERRLPLRARVELVRLTCLAIQHAHSKGVLHRDVKASNVLVAEVDGVAQPRVIDFGVAKALEGDGSDATALTHAGHAVGTPESMSPEQAGGAPDVDTRSDVYALGVLLHELLVGAPPFRLAGEGVAAVLELQRRIRDEEPRPPSAAARDPRPGRAVEGPIPPELDWIVLRALEKERERRYPTAAALAHDLERFLADLPVEAAPPSRTYRLRKLVRRHRAAALGAAAAALALLLGVAGTTVGLVRARSEAAEARRQERVAWAVATFLGEDVLAAAQPSADPGRGRDVLLVDALAAAGERIDAAARPGGRFAEAPLVEARLRYAIAESFVALGRGAEGLPHALRAFELDERELGPRHVDTLRSSLAVVDALLGAGRYGEARERAAEVVGLADEAHGPGSRVALDARRQLGNALSELGRYEEARDAFETALAAAQAAGVTDERELLPHRSGLAMARTALGEDASELAREVMEGYARVYGPDSPRALGARGNYAQVLRRAGRVEEAIPVLEEVVALQRELVGPAHPDALAAVQNLGLALFEAGRAELALAPLEEALELARGEGGVGPHHTSTLHLTSTLAIVRQTLGRDEEALATLREAHAGWVAVQGEDGPDAIQTYGNLGVMLGRLGRDAEAIEVLTEAHDRTERRFGPAHPQTLYTLQRLAAAELQTGRRADAERHWLELLDRADSSPAPAKLVSAALDGLVRLYQEDGRAADAAALLSRHGERDPEPGSRF